MDDIKALDKLMRDLRAEADQAANERSIAIARRVDTGQRGEAARIARALGIKEPNVTKAVKRGRELLARKGEG